MTKNEFVKKFNAVSENFLSDPKTEEVFTSIIADKQYTSEELISVIIRLSYQLTAKFTFDILSQVLELDEE